MGKIAVHEFITIDGVFEDPSFTFDYPFDPKMGVAIARIMGSSKAILLGRRTHEMFAPAWSVRTAADDPGAPFMNESPKYVVSGSLKNADYWNNSTVIGAYSADSIRRIKDQVDGNIYVSGSGTLVRAMLADGLVDELHLFVFPLSVGGGQRQVRTCQHRGLQQRGGSSELSNGRLERGFVGTVRHQVRIQRSEDLVNRSANLDAFRRAPRAAAPRLARPELRVLYGISDNSSLSVPRLSQRDHARR